MDNFTQEKARGLVPISSIIEDQYKADAYEYCNRFNELTLQGSVTKDERTPEDRAKDLEAIELLKELGECSNPALAYGFMLYNETGIVKQYWAKRCGLMRKQKGRFFDQDTYIDWLINIFSVLNGDHESIHDPLYSYKPGGRNTRGQAVGDYDVMNSFRTYWNMYCLLMLAKWCYKQDQIEMSSYNDVSIEQSLENADAGHHLDAELADKTNYSSPEDDMTYNEVEKVLRTFLKPEWSQPLRAGAKSGATSYLDLLKAIVSSKVSSLADLRKEFNLSQSVADSSLAKIQKNFSNYGLTLNDFATYLSKYPVVAKDILDGKKVSWSMEY